MDFFAGLCYYLLRLTIAVIVIGVSWILLRNNRDTIRKMLFKPIYSITEYERDVIYLFTFPRKWTRQLLNLSPYAVKLETWLRLKKLPYKIVETNQFSKSTKQIPYILYNGKEMADSDLIIEYLTLTFDLEKDDLDIEQEAVSRAFMRMVDESLSITHLKFRYTFMVNDFYGGYWNMFDKVTWQSRIFEKLLKSGIIMKFTTGSIGRHSQDIVGKIGQSDIKAISKFLGNKKFMFGDNITMVDCDIFGHLSQIVYLDLNTPQKQIIQSECNNVGQYVDRIRASIWPDWDELVNMNPFESAK